MQAEIRNQFRNFLLVEGYAKRTIANTLEFFDAYLAETPSNQLINWLLEKRSTGTYSASTLNRYIAYLHAWGRFIKDDNLLKLKYFKAQKSYTKKLLSDAEIEKFFAIKPDKYANQKKHKMHDIFFKLCFYTGMRPSEVASLKASDINFDTYEITVENTKNYQSRLVPIAHIIRKDIESYVYDLPADSLVCPLSANAWRASFNRRLKKIGVRKVKGLTTYSGRHKVGTEVYNVKGVFAAKKLLGHVKLESTEQYMHMDIKELHEAVDQMSHAKKGLPPVERLNYFTEEIVKKLFWDDSQFETSVTKNGMELSLTIKVKDEN